MVHFLPTFALGGAVDMLARMRLEVARRGEAGTGKADKGTGKADKRVTCKKSG
jgi:hypothetical protein